MTPKTIKTATTTSYFAFPRGAIESVIAIPICCRNPFPAARRPPIITRTAALWASEEPAPNSAGVKIRGGCRRIPRRRRRMSAATTARSLTTPNGARNARNLIEEIFSDPRRLRRHAGKRDRRFTLIFSCFGTVRSSKLELELQLALHECHLRNYHLSPPRVENSGLSCVAEDSRPRRTTIMAPHPAVKVTQSVIDTFDPLAKFDGKLKDKHNTRETPRFTTFAL